MATGINPGQTDTFSPAHSPNGLNSTEPSFCSIELPYAFHTRCAGRLLHKSVLLPQTPTSPKLINYNRVYIEYKVIVFKNKELKMTTKPLSTLRNTKNQLKNSTLR